MPVSPDSSAHDSEALRRLMAVARGLFSELDPDLVLRQILEQAQAMTGARYAAIGVLDDERTGIERFITQGIDDATAREIGPYPRGRGVLGVLIEDPRPLRLKSVGSHPHSFGFPSGHPPMGTFLGVPVVIRGNAWGNLYLTEKQGGADFTQADEDALVVLAQFAATAIENSRLYQQAEQGRQALQQAVRGLEAARSIADAIGAESDLERVLELIVKRGRALVEALTVLILLVDGEDLVAVAGAGVMGQQANIRFPLAGSTAGEVLKSGSATRITDVPKQLPIASAAFELGASKTALIVPMVYRASPLGVLMAFDHGPQQEPFSAADEQLLHTFAASAANAVAMSRSVEAGRLRSTIAAAEDERRRWARELHDQTLQSLAALRVQLARTGRQDDAVTMREMIHETVDDVDREIKNLRAIISDLRPSALDDLGLAAALEALIQRRCEDGLDIKAEIVLPGDGAASSMSPDLETTIYRIVQEALTNVVRHAGARSASVRVKDDRNRVEVRVVDDGRGFDSATVNGGFGLVGMRERVQLAGGSIGLESTPQGTALTASIPIRGPGT
jgi:signal transduction histidine kinase